jgi:hypothetical protein
LFALLPRGALYTAAAGDFITVSFTEFPNDTFLTDHYQPLGVLFLDGGDNIICCNENSFPEDGAGLDGDCSITLEFALPMTALAADFPGGLQCELYSNEKLVLISSTYGGAGAGNFGGLVTTEPFDTAVLFDWVGGQCPLAQVALDNLHFGPPAYDSADVNTDGVVDVLDLIDVIVAWGDCPKVGLCLADITRDDAVGVDDLVQVLLNWSQ